MTNNFSHQAFFFSYIPNFIKRKHPRKGEKKKQWAKTKVQASKQPKRGKPPRGKGTT
jgi:hypothetical protein